MRKLIVLLLCIVFMSSCSWFGSKSSSDISSLDAEVAMLGDEEVLASDNDIESLSNKASKGAFSEKDDLGDLDELDEDEDEDEDSNASATEEDSDKLAAELDLDDNELDVDEPSADNLNAEKQDEESDDVAAENLEAEGEGASVTESGSEEEADADVGKSQKDEGSYSDGFVDADGFDGKVSPEKGQASTDKINADSTFEDSNEDSNEDSFSDTPVKTYVSVKKIKTVPYIKNDILVNAVYIARKGDTLKGVSNKIYSLYKKTQLLKINSHLRKYTQLPVGTKIYYNSPTRPEDSTNLLTYYEEANLEPQAYTTMEGDNLRTLGKQLLGHSKSWQELWATNAAVESKGVLPAGISIRYWGKASADVIDSQGVAKNKAKQQAEQDQAEADLAVATQKKQEDKLALEANSLESQAEPVVDSTAGVDTDSVKNLATKENAVAKVAEAKTETETKTETKTETEAEAETQAETQEVGQEKVEAKIQEIGQEKVEVKTQEADQSQAELENKIPEQAVPKIEVSEKVVQPIAKVAAVTPVVVAEKSFVDQILSLLDDDVTLYGLMGLCILILAFLFMRKRKEQPIDNGNNEDIEQLDSNTAMFLGGSKKAMGATQVDATQMDATQMDATQMDATQMDATQMDATQMDATQMDATQMGTNLGLEDSADVSVFLSDDDDEKAIG
ncbi:MAG: LysM peptidoglycan-binding domain-containing protein [Bdellovibrionaceae bacterium]|nr:LysM peptidoglycan-binding domain-containing protein [Pseudobdellovibrionaceae bacterium]